MRKRVLRDYEVSVWTLQDDFIVVLKPFGVEIKGQLQSPKLVIKDDGTQEFNFSIPKFYTIEGQKIKNPLWETTNNGTLVQDMRKIKVILNKKRPNEAVFEFLIIKVEEAHDKDSLMCEVSCEGLAFHELGKTGYKLALEADDFINDTYQYYKGTVVNNEYILGEDGKKYPLEQPQETLNYWNNKVFKNNLSWTYEVRMNYAMRVGKGYQSNKVYEDDYISAWEYDEAKNMIVAKEYSGPKEKWRPVDLKESNVYNITQELAKAFGVFCRYEYTHDENYHITGRKVIYYNNFIAEGEGLIDITYPYTLGSITKTSDVTDLVTLLFVNTVKDNDDWNTIMDSAANKTREDYILNFNYLKEKGDLTPTQIKAIDQFEIEMYKANAILIPTGIKINNLVDKLPELEANIKVLENSIPLDDERILEADDLLNEVTNNTGIVPVTEANPKTGVIISKSDKPKDNYVNITEKGIYVNTLHVYRFFDSGTTARELSGECAFTPVYDEYGNLIQITNVYPLSDDTVGFTESYRVYMTYDYSPSFYYEKVKEIWKNRKAADEKNLADLNKQHDAIEKELEELRKLYAETMEQKELNMARFYRLMGPALREGYWAPDDYKDYGDHYNSIFNPTGAEIASMVLEDNIETPKNYLDDGGNSIIGDKFIYDKERINDEQLNYIDNFEDPENKLYYPCLRITKRSALWSYVQKHWDDFSLIFYDVTDLNQSHKKPEFLLGYRIGSKCQYAFLEINGKPELVIMVTGPRDDGLPSRQFAALTGQTHPDPAQGGSDLDEFDNAEVKLGVIDLLTKTNVGESVAIQKSDWYLLPADMLYPRIQINSLLLKTVADELLLKYNNKGLEEFKDYTVLSRDNSYYITFFPQVFVRDGFTNGSIAYTIANANTAIYLDAIQVSKENAYPKVEYEAKINSINKDFIDNVYNMLGRIANINDTESGLKNVQGYISELELALDKPQDDSVKIKNYKTKFEDLFSTIVAQTEAMQKNGPTFSTIASGFTADGTLTKDTMQQTLNRVDLDYAFAHGTLTISDTDGIWARSNDGVVAMRGGGIFTSTVPKNDEGTDWVWNTGITPQGINASLITTGQLDTNLIRIYAGDNVKFQLNASGLYAYKTVTENFQPGVDSGWKQELANNGYIDSKQYVVHNEDGLFLRLENGASVNGRPIPLTEPLDRVAISWNGLTLKNYEGKTVFCADANTGDLEITGKITATSGEFHGDIYANSFLLNTDQGEQTFDDYMSTSVASVVAQQVRDEIQNIDPVAKTVEIVGEDVFLIDANTSPITITPASITLNAQVTGLTEVGNWYINDNLISYGTTPYTITVNTNTSGWNNNRLVIKYLITHNNTEYYDIKTIYKVSNGLNGTNGADGTSFTIKGTKQSSSELEEISNPQIGDGYVINGELWVYGENNQWINLGSIKGQDGKGIVSVLEEYGANNDETTPPNSWDTLANAQTQWDIDHKFLWNKETTTYTTGNPDIITHIVAIFTKDGAGISQITEHYQTNNNSAQAPNIPQNSDWGTSILAVSSTQPYLWNYEKITYTDERTPTRTTPRIISSFVRGITSVQERYLATDSTTAPSESATWYNIDNNNLNWGIGNKYLWNKEITTYTDGSESSTVPHIIAIYTQDGEQGAAGRGITSIVEYYKVTDLNTTPTNNTDWTYTTIAGALQEHALSKDYPHLWNYEKITLTDNTIIRTDPRIISYYTESPTIYELWVSTPVVVKSITGSTTTYSPNKITLQAKQKTGNNDYANYNGIIKVGNTVLNNQEYTIQNDNKITFDLYDTAGTNLLDSQTVTVIGDGAPGTDGVSPYNVILTNENISFPSGTTGSATCDILVYQGTVLQPFTIGTITYDNQQSDLPTGMTITSSSAADQKSTTLTIETTNTFNSAGQLNIPINVANNGPTFNMHITYSVVGVGAKGDTGEKGEAGYTVFLTNENHSFSASTLGVLYPTTVTIQAKVYQGITPQSCSVSINSNNNIFYTYCSISQQSPDTITLTIPSNSSLDVSNITQGTFDITITCNNGSLQFIRTFSYQITKEPDTIISSETLYYLKTNNTTVPQITSSNSNDIKNTDTVNYWTTVIPTFQSGGSYYTCEQYTWKSGTTTWSAPKFDARINEAFKASQITSLISTNGISGPGWWGPANGANSIEYNLLLGSSSSTLPMLIASNSGIVMAKGTNTTPGAAVIINQHGISMNGSNLNLTGTSNVNITGGNLTLSAYDDQDIFNSDLGNITMTGGKLDLEGGSIKLYSAALNSGVNGEPSSEFNLNRDGLNLTYKVEEVEVANITMNSSGMSLTGSNIIINDKPIWSHENIIIMNPNLQEYIEDVNGTYKSSVVGYRAWTPEDGTEFTRYKLENNNYIQDDAGAYVYDTTITYTLIGANETPDTKYSKNADYWRSSVERIEQYMTGHSDWVLVKPTYDAVLRYNLERASEGSGSAHTLTGQFYSLTPDVAFGNHADWYQYDLTFTFHAYNSATVQSFKVFLSNSPIDTNNTSGLISIDYHDANTGIIIGGTDSSGDGGRNTGSTGKIRRNLCLDDTTIYYCIKVQYNAAASIVLEDIILECRCDATQSRVPCTLYYYP